jgi:hypothetical protein
MILFDFIFCQHELNSQFIKIFLIVPTIGLLLAIIAQGVHLHTSSSTVEIFENAF